MLKPTEQEKHIIANIDQKVHKMRFLNKETYNEIKTQMESFKKQTFSEKYRVPHKKFKILVVGVSLITFHYLDKLREIMTFDILRRKQQSVEHRKMAPVFQICEDKLSNVIEERNAMVMKIAEKKADHKLLHMRIPTFYTLRKEMPYTGRVVLTTGGVVNFPQPVMIQLLGGLSKAGNTFNI